jgi:hypothetical protein
MGPLFRPVRNIMVNQSAANFGVFPYNGCRMHRFPDSLSSREVREKYTPNPGEE